jgi:hypothetical protein
VSGIQGDSVLVRDPGMIAAEMDGDLVMMSVERGAYFGIGGVGTRVWELLEEPRSVDQLCAAIVTEYEVDEATCRGDVVAFVQRLLDEKLVKPA